MSTPDAYACRLSPDELPARRSQVAALTQHVRHSERTSGRLTVDLAPEAASLADDFVRDESRCCPFFGFDLRTEHTGVRLEVSAPEGAEETLDELARALRDGPTTPEVPDASS